MIEMWHPWLVGSTCICPFCPFIVKLHLNFSDVSNAAAQAGIV